MAAIIRLSLIECRKENNKIVATVWSQKAKLSSTEEGLCFVPRIWLTKLAVRGNAILSVKCGAASTFQQLMQISRNGLTLKHYRQCQDAYCQSESSLWRLSARRRFDSEPRKIAYLWRSINLFELPLGRYVRPQKEKHDLVNNKWIK